MMSMPKKAALSLFPIVLVAGGMFLLSGERKQSFGSTAEFSATFPTSNQADQTAQTDGGVGNPAPTGTDDDVARKSAVTEEVTEKPATGVKKADPVAADATKTDTGSASDFSVTDRLVSFGYESRSSRDIDTVVVHSSYDALGSDPYSVSGIINEYRQYGVSAHYLIDRKGTIYRLVKDRDIAYHAGVSKVPDGRTGVNGFSIGIEVVEKDTDSPTSAQYASLRVLVASLKKKYPIKYVLGHDDIAPGRKTDPWGFDWKEMKQ